MQIAALIQVIDYLKAKSGDNALSEGYRNLSEKIRNSPSLKEGEFPEEILSEKEELRRLLIDSDPVNLSYSSYNLFEKYNKEALFGKAAAVWLDQLFEQNRNDLKAISNELGKKSKQVTKFAETLVKYQQMFDQILPDEFTDKNEDSLKPMLVLYFVENLQVQSIADLERYAKLWDCILGSFSRLTGEFNHSLEVSSFKQGRLILGVSIEERTLGVIMNGFFSILAVLPAILKIRKVQLEIAQLRLTNNNYHQLLEEEIRILIHNTAEESAIALVSENSPELRKDEAVKDELVRSLKQVLSFVEKGGKIEYKVPSGINGSADMNKLLIESFTMVRDIEKMNDSLKKSLTGEEAR
ncbi:MAG TPA: hypothetical protein VHO46_06195 [Bacteroidales bacterium]|nr:hypothetical protein [Bacteroidales bacterium]